ncbi:hypothetical protein PHYPO_G00232600 [Pangasianodon hypophthalmus]|uniref:Uncharacterized protein n=1 Tax=Pangasianodon hypophthalmus TaxID=310915 RepID=A0A5N5NMC5_PANHP|nr:hypothetical protein PHYPO_G00232600 [Pangasianodon hypophthalmus]
MSIQCSYRCNERAAKLGITCHQYFISRFPRCPVYAALTHERAGDSRALIVAKLYQLQWSFAQGSRCALGIAENALHARSDLYAGASLSPFLTSKKHTTSNSSEW